MKNLSPREFDGSRQVRKSDEMVLCPAARNQFQTSFKLFCWEKRVLFCFQVLLHIGNSWLKDLLSEKHFPPFRWTRKKQNLYIPMKPSLVVICEGRTGNDWRRSCDLNMSLLISGSIKSDKGKKQIRNGKNKMKRSVKEWTGMGKKRKRKQQNKTKERKMGKEQ